MIEQPVAGMLERKRAPCPGSVCEGGEGQHQWLMSKWTAQAKASWSKVQSIPGKQGWWSNRWLGWCLASKAGEAQEANGD